MKLPLPMPVLACICAHLHDEDETGTLAAILLTSWSGYDAAVRWLYRDITISQEGWEELFAGLELDGGARDDPISPRMQRKLDALANVQRVWLESTLEHEQAVYVVCALQRAGLSNNVFPNLRDLVVEGDAGPTITSFDDLGDFCRTATYCLIREWKPERLCFRQDTDNNGRPLTHSWLACMLTYWNHDVDSLTLHGSVQSMVADLPYAVARRTRLWTPDWKRPTEAMAPTTFPSTYDMTLYLAGQIQEEAAGRLTEGDPKGIEEDTRKGISDDDPPHPMWELVGWSPTHTLERGRIKPNTAVVYWAKQNLHMKVASMGCNDTKHQHDVHQIETPHWAATEPCICGAEVTGDDEWWSPMLAKDIASLDPAESLSAQDLRSLKDLRLVKQAQRGDQEYVPIYTIESLHQSPEDVEASPCAAALAFGRKRLAEQMVRDGRKILRRYGLVKS